MPPIPEVTKREVRSFPVREFRVEQGEDGKQYLTGYAACYGVKSEILADRNGRFREVIVAGAFTRALKESQDVRHLINHDPSLLLGRTIAGTTRLTEDEKGLHFRTLAGTRTYEVDLIKSMERGDISDCSFCFTVNGEKGQRWLKDPENPTMELRELHDVDLADVSVVTYPAYPNTSATVSMRAMFPDGMPTEVRTRFEKRNAECECSCESCVAGNCDNCTDTECDDPNCEPNFEDKAKAHARPAPVVCLCLSADCPKCADDYAFARSLQAGDVRARTLCETRSQTASEFRSAVDPADPKTLEMFLYGDIGESYWGGGISADGIRAQIGNAPAHDKIRLRIHSFGGDAFEGVTIGNYLKSTGKEIEVCVDGLAASAASIIAMCGKTINMAPNAMMMVHNASTIVYGYASEMRKTADTLDKISQSVAQTYVSRTGKSAEYVQSLMDAETWMSAADCVKDGFATAIVDPDGDDMSTRAAKLAVESRAIGAYKNVPERFLPAAVKYDESGKDADRQRRLRLALAS